MERESVEVTLGGETYTVYALSIRESKVWRKLFVEELKPMFDGLSAVPNIEFNSPGDLLALLPLVESLLLDGIDKVVELLFAYSPELTEQREAIEETATDKEAMAAFQEVLRLADPFGMMGSFGPLSGRANGGTRSKSRSRSGGSRKSG